MYRLLLTRLFFCLVIMFPASAQAKKNIIARGARLEKLAGGFIFTEGPAADKAGNVYFTDQPNDKILKWSVDGVLTTFCNLCGRANGLYFDQAGNLISCSDQDNELWSIDMAGDHQVLVKDFNGKKLNGPNDLWIRPDGGIYFTDPLYVRSYWSRDPAMQQEGQHVYYLSPDRTKLAAVDTDLVTPNGIIGSPDGKTLRWSPLRAGKTYRYSIQKDGSLSHKTLFAPMGSDGMTIDCHGNVYLTGHGVTVFNAKGEKIEHIPVETKWTANVTFGGRDRKTLFITASESIYGLRMNVRGTE